MSPTAEICCINTGQCQAAFISDDLSKKHASIKLQFCSCKHPSLLCKRYQRTAGAIIYNCVWLTAPIHLKPSLQSTSTSIVSGVIQCFQTNKPNTLTIGWSVAVASCLLHALPGHSHPCLQTLDHKI
jgi:hypothetical protein